MSFEEEVRERGGEGMMEAEAREERNAAAWDKVGFI